MAQSTPPEPSTASARAAAHRSSTSGTTTAEPGSGPPAAKSLLPRGGRFRVEICIDFHQRTTPAYAIRLARELAPMRR